MIIARGLGTLPGAALACARVRAMEIGGVRDRGGRRSGQRGRGLWADLTVDGETIRFLECDDSRFPTPTEVPSAVTGKSASPPDAGSDGPMR